LSGRDVAFVTGASRGIGKATALALAEAGFDLVLVARTLREGERFEHSPRLGRSDTRPLPGSLATTAAEAEARGAAVLTLRLDLLEPDGIEPVVTASLERFGHLDLLVNNAVYTGPGNLDLVLDLPVAAAERIFRANVFSPLDLTRRVLAGMLQRGGGRIVNVSSAVAVSDPPAPAGRGGWGFGYAASKAAFHRLAGILAAELGERGIRAYNLEPGFVWTEAMEQMADEQGFAGRYQGAPPGVPAAVIAWLARTPEAEAWNGRTVDAQRLCAERGLLPDWPSRA
jgi:NAD(P)-dependent dehydrogenase (short-subunit alcohol dehydrogenase family)